MPGSSELVQSRLSRTCRSPGRFRDGNEDPKPLHDELGIEFLLLRIPEPSSSPPSPADPFFFQAPSHNYWNFQAGIQEFNPPESLHIPAVPGMRDLTPNPRSWVDRGWKSSEKSGEREGIQTLPGHKLFPELGDTNSRWEKGDMDGKFVWEICHDGLVLAVRVGKNLWRFWDFF